MYKVATQNAAVGKLLGLKKVIGGGKELRKGRHCGSLGAHPIVLGVIG